MATNDNALPIDNERELEAESHAPYLQVWFGLAVLTGIEYVYAAVFKDSFAILVLGLLFWAMIKAGMVGWYFMHLKFEGRWVYLMLIPAAVLATILVVALYPDQALKPITEENPPEDQAYHAPIEPGQERSSSRPASPAPAVVLLASSR
jgi:cytochrome c oxidase subunit 4